MQKPKTQNLKPKTYVLGMFPYPSGDGLHVGHVRIYTAVDVMARYFRARGMEVMSPMGWDAFGLPAENAAIKNKMNPQDIVPRNYNNFRSQMQNMQFSFDWEHEFATTDPTYYGLTQWIFLELYKKGLVYREQVPINWCPKCMTGLANEEVLPDGTHERCGTPTGKKMLPQWVMKITKYADRLLNDLDSKGTDLQGSSLKGLDWPRGILEMQKNWIGKKEGINIEYGISNIEHSKEKITCFTTTPVNWGATFVVLAPEHEIVTRIRKGEFKISKEIREGVNEYYKKSMARSEVDRQVETKDKTGVFTGLYVKNHVTNEDIPVWISDFVLASVGTGAVQGCPGHDMRDFEFAKKFGIPIRRVVVGPDGDMSPIEKPEQVIEKGMNGKMVNSDFLDGLEFKEAMGKTMDYFEEKGWGKRTVSYHLRDWVFSRQRYWGEPIPLVYCPKCGDENGVVPLTEKDLPLELPYLKSYEPTETGESPLSRVTEWVNCKCPKCGGEAKRETDTMPNWAGSCWYHLAFAFWRNSENSDNQKIGQSENSEDQNVRKSVDQRETKKILDEYKKKSGTPYSDFWKEYAQPKIEKWLPVDWYLGGAEHAVLHLLYARFWNKVLYDLGHLSFVEPYLRLRSVGIVLAEDGRKMSKSWGNVINPDDVVKEYGSDAVRLYEMFMGPWDQAISWDSRALVGMKRFLERTIDVATKAKSSEPHSLQGSELNGKSSPQLVLKLAKLIKQVERGITEQKFNTAIAGCMEFVNEWRNNDYVLSGEHKNMFAQILSPFAPTAAKKIWDKAVQIGWPTLAEVNVGEVPVTIAVQINGKMRATVQVGGNIAKDQKQVEEVVLADERVKKWLTGEVKKVIFIPGKLMNLIV